jgi:hypothetical protein
MNDPGRGTNSAKPPALRLGGFVIRHWSFVTRHSPFSLGGLIILAILVAAVAHREWALQHQNIFLEAEVGARPTWAATYAFGANDNDFDRMTRQLGMEGAVQMKRHSRAGDKLELVVFMRRASERQPSDLLVWH